MTYVRVMGLYCAFIHNRKKNDTHSYWKSQLTQPTVVNKNMYKQLGYEQGFG